MLIEVDLVDQIVLLLDKDMKVRDAFQARGKTSHETDFSVTAYTYRSFLTMPGFCFLCGMAQEDWQERCVSSSGYHAFVGLNPDADLPEGHRAENRNVAMVEIVYDEFRFFVEPDNLFPLEKPAEPFAV